MIRDYYHIIKPGIIYGNVLTIVAGFCLASYGQRFDFPLLLLTVIGLSLIMAGGCVFNNYYDRDIDALMERTKNRALVRNVISGQAALIYATALSLVGFITLFLFTNITTVLVALLGFVVYVGIYTMVLKRTSTHSTLIGAISGAVPPIVGYVAVRGEIDLGAVIVFLILATWQMSHAFAIAIYRFNDYKAARIPVLPVSKGINITKIQMMLYIFLCIGTSLLLSFFNYTSPLYFYVMAIFGLAWLLFCIKGFFIKHDAEKAWARKMFLGSLAVLLVFCGMVAGGW